MDSKTILRLRERRFDVVELRVLLLLAVRNSCAYLKGRDYPIDEITILLTGATRLKKVNNFLVNSEAH